MTLPRLLLLLTGLPIAAYAQLSLLQPLPEPLPVSTAISISRFDAKGDGKTDDTKPFQAALAWQAINGGSLQLGGTTYLLTHALAISKTHKPLSILGGEGTILLFAPATALDNAIVLANDSAVELRGFTIRGSGAGLHHALSVFYSRDVRLDHLHIDNIRGAGLSAVAGIVLGNDNRISITNSEFTAVGPGGDEPAFAIWNYYRMHSEDIHIDHNHIHDSSVHIAIGMFDTDHSSVTDNTIDGGDTCILHCNNNGYGVLFYRVDFHGLQPASAPKLLDEVISGNHISNTAGSAVYLASVDHAKITANTITRSTVRMDDSSLPGAAIALNGSDNISISENIIQQDGEGGVCLATTNDILVQGNRISNSAKWGIHLRVKNVRTTISNNTIDAAPVGVLVEPDATELILGKNTDTNVRQPLQRNGWR